MAPATGLDDSMGALFGPCSQAFLDHDGDHAVDGATVGLGGSLNRCVGLIRKPEREAHHDTRIVHDTKTVVGWCHE